MRVLLLAVGSHGDVHPAVAIARALIARGHEPRVAANPYFERVVTDAGAGFEPLGERFDLGEAIRSTNIMTGPLAPFRLFRRFVVPTIDPSADELTKLINRLAPDGVVNHPLSVAGPPVCEALGVPWISTALAPISWWNPADLPLFSALDRTHPPRLLSRAGVFIARSVCRLMLDGPINRLRKRLGLRPGRDLFVSQTTGGGLSLGLWSRHFREPLASDPPGGVTCGFPVFDDLRDYERDRGEIESFLAAGDAPIVFTLGTAGVHAAGRFYEAAAKACSLVDRRGILLTGRPEYAPRSVPRRVAVFPAASFSRLFPRCRAVVHHGGIGTIAQALRAGRPQLVTPMSHDQFDNSARVKRLGAGQRLEHARVNAERLAPLLLDLETPGHTGRAAELGSRIRAEDGATSAAIAIEDFLSSLAPYRHAEKVRRGDSERSRRR
ncbi:MAG TPA: glycosyltransferase [Tepidisphaeraceae bacterium]|nr:glycosyltransferase [Tepidisphaeraceae bacterium]